MWSVLAEAIEIEREARRLHPQPLPVELADKLLVLTLAARRLGIDLVREVRWVPHEDMTPEYASQELELVNAAIGRWEQQAAVLRKRDLPLHGSLADFRAYRDRLKELLRDLDPSVTS